MSGVGGWVGPLWGMDTVRLHVPICGRLVWEAICSPPCGVNAGGAIAPPSCEIWGSSLNANIQKSGGTKSHWIALDEIDFRHAFEYGWFLTLESWKAVRCWRFEGFGLCANDSWKHTSAVRLISLEGRGHQIRSSEESTASKRERERERKTWAIGWLKSVWPVDPKKMICWFIMRDCFYFLLLYCPELSWATRRLNVHTVLVPGRWGAPMRNQRTNVRALVAKYAFAWS